MLGAPRRHPLRSLPQQPGSTYVPDMLTRSSALPEQVTTVGAMLRAGVLVRARCQGCGNVFDVDLHSTAQLRGRDFSLVDKRSVCRISACRGHLTFLYALTPGEMLLPLLTSPGNEPPEPPQPRSPRVPRARPRPVRDGGFETIASSA